ERAAQLDLFATPAPAGASAAAAPGALRAVAPPWQWTRPWLISPHRKRAARELDCVRAHFPELDGVTIKVGLTKRRNILGPATLSGDPCIWIRPRHIRRFVIAHEFTHLLQARKLVPGGEKTCDLYALTRGAAVIDFAPTYLTIPQAFTLAAPGR